MHTASTPSPAPDSLAARVERHLLYNVGVAPAEAGTVDLMSAVSQVARAELSRRWVAGDTADRAAKARRVYYLSMEFLIGRSLGNALAALGLDSAAAGSVGHHARTLEDIQAREPDAALGNGGLGRLAACFLDSMASVGLPSYGYGIRYEFGMFAQSIAQGRQIEHPDPWLEDGTPWEFPRPGVHYPVRFGGWVERAESPDARAGVAPCRRGVGQGLRPCDPRPRHRARQHAAPVEGRRAGPHRPACLQLGRLRPRRRVQEPVREHLLGAVPQRQHARRA
jgi:starch phosphorylase